MLTIELPTDEAITLKAGDLVFKINRYTHNKGEGFYIQNLSPGEVGTIYEKEK